MSERKFRTNPATEVRSERRGPVDLNELVTKFAREHRLQRNDDRERVFTAWRRAVGPALTRQAWPVRWRSGELLIEVASAAHYHELSAFRSQELLHAMAQQLGDDRVKKLVFKPGTRPSASDRGSSSPPRRRS